METSTSITELALFLATSTGSGLAASWFFDRLRALFPYPQVAPASAPVAWFYRLLWAPRYARYTSIALAIIVASVASGAVAIGNGADYNVVASAFAAPVIAQIRHGLSLSAE